MPDGSHFFPNEADALIMPFDALMADMYSVGVLLSAMLSGKEPDVGVGGHGTGPSRSFHPRVALDGNKDERYYVNIPWDVDPADHFAAIDSAGVRRAYEALAFVRDCCLAADPLDRPTAEQLLRQNIPP